MVSTNMESFLHVFNGLYKPNILLMNRKICPHAVETQGLIFSMQSISPLPASNLKGNF